MEGVAAARDLGWHSVAGAPLRGEGKIFGSVQLRTASPEGYSERDIALSDEIASEVSGAIANDRLRADLEREATLRRALEGCDAAVFLVHSSGEADYSRREAE